MNDGYYKVLAMFFYVQPSKYQSNYSWAVLSNPKSCCFVFFVHSLKYQSNQCLIIKCICCK